MLDSIKIPKEPLRDIFEIIMNQPWAAEQEDKLADLWNICDDREQQCLLKELLLKFTVLDFKQERAALEGISDAFQAWSLKPENTLVIAVANDHEIDGSTAGLQKLKNKIIPVEQWHSKFVSNIPSSIARVKNGMSLVLFDDFIGTGKKMVKKINWIKKKITDERGLDVDIQSLTFYMVSFSAMKFGLEYIEAHGHTVYSFLLLDKGITDSSDDPLIVKNKIDLMVKIESKLSAHNKNKAIKDYSLGYDKSECLYIGQNDNCPNNVFPAFWWPTLISGEDHEPLFIRAG